MYPRRPDFNDEIISIRAELRQLEHFARELSDKWLASFQRLDALRSGTGVFPPEILSLIFQYACAPGSRWLRRYRHFPPLYFGSISHSWRQVAWSTPQLWTTLSLSISPDNAIKLASVLDLYLTNGCGLPFSLSMWFYSRAFPNIEDDPVAQVFFREESSRKFGSLSLRNLPTSWLSHFDGPYSQLVDTEISCRDDSGFFGDTPFFPNAPMLRKVSFWDNVPPKAPWSSVTTLILERIPAAVALRCLLESPNLVEFHFNVHIKEDQSDEELEEPPEVPNIFTLHHLETLTWTFKPNRASDLFLRHIRLPILRSLALRCTQPPPDTFSEGIRIFFRNLWASAPLTTLRLGNMLGLNFAEYIYRKSPRIEKLCLDGCDEDTLCFTLISLTPGWNGNKSADERMYLPKLRRLEVGGSPEYDSYLPECFGEVLANLLVGREREGSVPDLCIDFIYMPVLRWMPGTREKVKKLINGGPKVQFLEDGRQMYEP